MGNSNINNATGGSTEDKVKYGNLAMDYIQMLLDLTKTFFSVAEIERVATAEAEETYGVLEQRWLRAMQKLVTHSDRPDAEIVYTTLAGCHDNLVPHRHLRMRLCIANDIIGLLAWIENLGSIESEVIEITEILQEVSATIKSIADKMPDSCKFHKNLTFASKAEFSQWLQPKIIKISRDTGKFPKYISKTLRFREQLTSLCYERYNELTGPSDQEHSPLHALINQDEAAQETLKNAITLRQSLVDYTDATIWQPVFIEKKVAQDYEDHRREGMRIIGVYEDIDLTLVLTKSILGSYGDET